MKHRWDIFCSVVDNFGDIGVCWRLARRLSCELGQQVRLWVDDLATFKSLRPAIDNTKSAQQIDGIDVRFWMADFSAIAPADIVVEGFGVRLPEVYVEAMAARRRAPVWITFEYLSAEPWVDSHHGLPSPHPRLPLTKHFFFPGFTAATGGVLIEAGHVQARDEFQRNIHAQAEFRHSIGIDVEETGGCWLSLFCYENAALPGLVAAWSRNPGRVNCVVPAGFALRQIEAIAARPIETGRPVEIGNLRVIAVPFLDPCDYDRLLWSCDLNFVRGEDSFVRAQLAARPLVWQAYPQDDNAHFDKSAAFWVRYSTALNEACLPNYACLFDGWNRQAADCGDFWSDDCVNAALQNARIWAGQLAENGDLAVNLAKFCEDRLE